MPRVSVVIPTFNREGFVRIAIDSVLKQTYRDLEVIVCDDGSTDNTVEVVKSIQAVAELPIRLEVLPVNLGVSAARNKAISLAHGELIGFLDSDDSWLPQKLEKQVNFLDRNPDFVGVGCRGEFIAENRGLDRVYSPNLELNQSSEIFQMLYEPYINSSSVLVKKDALELAGLFDMALRTSEDRDLWWRLPRLGRIGFLNEVLVRLVSHDSNASNALCGMTSKTYIPVVKKTVWYWRDKLTGEETRKILSRAHLLAGYDAAEGGSYLSCIRHAATAMLYGQHVSEAIKLILSRFLRVFRG